MANLEMLKTNPCTIRLVLFSCILVGACSGKGHAPVVSPANGETGKQSGTKQELSVKQSRMLAERPPTYQVRRGDTLYSIAWNYGFDYREVARWNGIKSPYTIFPGQEIRLDPPARVTAKPSATGTKPDRKKAVALTPGPIEKKQAGSPSVEEIPAQKTTADPVPAQTVKSGPVSGPIRWSWPVKGTLVKTDTPISKNGIDISGREGAPINAAARGEVVYSGSGLLGYGRLIIIKHNDTYLSAYAHNKELLVKEGDHVNVGQNIALMGQTSNGRTLLHFEIRKDGKPVDPLKYLPQI